MEPSQQNAWEQSEVGTLELLSARELMTSYIIDCQPENTIQVVPDPVPASNRHIGCSRELLDKIEAKFLSL